MSSGMGIDRSGNGNHWGENNLTATDQMVGSPTNNFCTLNQLGWQWSKRSGTMSEGNLKCFTSGADWTHVNGTMIIPKDKKIYFEVYGVDGKTYGGVALADENAGAYSAGSRPDGGWIKGLISGYADQADAFPCFRTEVDGTALGTLTNSGSGFHNAVCGIAVDQANSNVKFYVNNSLVEDITSASCFNTTSDYIPIFAGYSGGQQVMNFGQDSSFAGIKTAQGNQDGGGIGDFYYTPPTGYLALCTSNLPAADIIPSEQFNSVIYTGNGADNRGITGVGFQPDLVWGKARSNSNSHRVADAVRGATNIISPDTQDDEYTDNSVVSFDSDGYTTSRTSGNLNDNTWTYVAWNWLAGNAISGTGDFTQGSLASTCSRNVDAGFSIVSYTGNLTGGATVGHGLSKAPEMIIVKNRTLDGEDWRVYHSGIASDAETDYMNLNTTSSASDNAAMWYDTAPSATLITLGADAATNGDEATIAYCFHSVDGYSKVGSYKGNGSSDGSFSHLGFRPAFVLIKCHTTSEPWSIRDSVRHPANQATTQNILKPDNAAAELTTGFSVDLLSNGFKCRQGGAEINDSSHSYIYLAFAETPFKYSNAR